MTILTKMKAQARKRTAIVLGTTVLIAVLGYFEVPIASDIIEPLVSALVDFADAWQPVAEVTL